MPQITVNGSDVDPAGKSGVVVVVRPDPAGLAVDKVHAVASAEALVAELTERSPATWTDGTGTTTVTASGVPSPHLAPLALREQDARMFPHDEPCPTCGRRQWTDDTFPTTCQACGAVYADPDSEPVEPAEEWVTDGNGVQRRDLPDGYWAEVTPDGLPDGYGWTWVINDGGADVDEIAGGVVRGEAAAKQAVRDWADANTGPRPLPVWDEADPGAPVVHRGRPDGRTLYRKPTFTSLGTGGHMIADRADVRVRAALDDGDGGIGVYEALIDQSELFRLLWPKLRRADR